jgi:sugar phosphate isomerase/epimerase
MRVAFHNHSDVKHPNEFATPASFEKAWEMSKYYVTNLDIGHFMAANFDPVSFIEANHARISHLHIKDRKKDQGPNRPWGEGDTPIKEVLQLIKKNRYPIPCYQEFEYRVPEGSSSAAEWKRCKDYLISGLA